MASLTRRNFMKFAGLTIFGLSLNGPSFLMPRNAQGGPLDYVPGVQGVAYEPFLNSALRTEAQIRQDIQLIGDLRSPAIRLYGLEGALANIPSICQEENVPFYAGARLTNDAGDQQQLDALIGVARAGHSNALGYVVGTKMVTDGRMTVDDLVSAIRYVKDQTADLWPAGTIIPITTAEDCRIWRDNPVLSEECYGRIVHVTPYEDGISIDDANDYFLDHTMEITAMNGHPIMAFTGWPSSGPSNGNAVASVENQEAYMRFVVGVQGSRRYFVPAFDGSGLTSPDTQGIYYPDRREKEFTEAITPGGHPDTNDDTDSGNEGGDSKSSGCYIDSLLK